jgi:MFS family permease
VSSLLFLEMMACASNIPSLVAAYIVIQFSSNMAQAPFHALLPDLVPTEQRGLASGVMELLLIAGNVGGVIAASMFVDASKPLAVYHALRHTLHANNLDLVALLR